MDKEKIIKLLDAKGELTVSEVKLYQKLVKPQKHVYGRYGTLAKEYLEKHNVGKLWALAGDLPKYLHNVDKQAEELYDIMYEKLSSSPEFQRTGDYMEDVCRINGIKKLIEEEILNEIVYV